MVSMNFSYVMCILADHDTLEAAVTNHVDVDVEPLPPAPQSTTATANGKQEQTLSGSSNNNTTSNDCKILGDAANSSLDGNYGKVDWGETQVRNSSNFSNHWGGDLFAYLHGGINYQIEHHLFPGMSHIHYPTIAPIVRKTCEEFDIPYAAYSTLPETWYSFLLLLRSLNKTPDALRKTDKKVL
jgi:hypothetical protein